MIEINSEEQIDRDWDWYAFDQDGMVGHFATAGRRKLPKTVLQDRDGALRLIQYFDEEAAKRSPYVIRAEAEADAGGWKDELDRARYLRSFVDMGSKGLFSYDTFLSRPDEYYLVASPGTPLHIDQLPNEIRDMIVRTKSTYLFAKSTYIPEADTLQW
jgi:hypothetical protein